MTTRVAIHGATGRMGVRLLALAAADPDFTVAAAVASPTSAYLGRDAGDLAGVGPLHVPISATLATDAAVDAVIDFSTPEACLAVVKECAARGLPVLVATTGFAAVQRAEIDAASHHVPVLVASNTSLAVNVLAALARRTGELLAGRGFDVEIIERHHRYKKDAPSGTALTLAAVIQKAMGQTELRHGREGLVGERPPHEIGIHSLRVGDNVGEHTIVFGAPGETIELVQKATNRDCYARGALSAARFLVGKSAGRYTMADVLGL